MVAGFSLFLGIADVDHRQYDLLRQLAISKNTGIHMVLPRELGTNYDPRSRPNVNMHSVARNSIVVKSPDVPPLVGPGYNQKGIEVVLCNRGDI
jgi:hypothetical protein